MTMIHLDPAPLRVEEDGTIRVANTRITLDVLLGFLLNGVTPEQVASNDYYPTLSLADVYGVLAYYYRHQAELDEYLQKRRASADAMQKEIESTQLTFAEYKARLLERRNTAHAPSTQ